MHDNPPTPSTRQGALQSARLLWFGLIAGQLIFLGVIIFLISGGGMSTSAGDIANILHYVNLAMLVVAVPAAHILRSQVFKRHWEDNVVTPEGFVQGTILFLALLEGVSLFALVIVLMSGTFWPYIVPSVVALGVQAYNWPTGRPMEQDEMEMMRK